MLISGNLNDILSCRTIHEQSRCRYCHVIWLHPVCEHNCSLPINCNKQLIAHVLLFDLKSFSGLEILQFVSRNLDFLHLTIKAGMHAGPAGTQLTFIYSCSVSFSLQIFVFLHLFSTPPLSSSLLFSL